MMKFLKNNVLLFIIGIVSVSKCSQFDNKLNQLIRNTIPSEEGGHYELVKVINSTSDCVLAEIKLDLPWHAKVFGSRSVHCIVEVTIDNGDPYKLKNATCEDSDDDSQMTFKMSFFSDKDKSQLKTVRDILESKHQNFEIVFQYPVFQIHNVNLSKTNTDVPEFDDYFVYYCVLNQVYCYRKEIQMKGDKGKPIIYNRGNYEMESLNLKNSYSH